MAEIKSTFGKIRGKVGNVIGYVRADGKNFCKSCSARRLTSKEEQKRQAVAFGTLTHMLPWMLEVVNLGFPGGKKYPKGPNGFTSANGWEVVTTVKIDPEKPFSKRKNAMKQFRGIVDYGKLQMAAGPLVPPATKATFDPENLEVTFDCQKQFVESVDSFLDDNIYGILISGEQCICLIYNLGKRGETISRNIRINKKINPYYIALYTFATNAEGKLASSSVCLHEPLIQPGTIVSPFTE